MNEVDLAFRGLLIILAICLSVAALFYPLWIFLHKALPKNLDPLLFKEPYFQKSELANYQFFPLNFVKTINYIYLVAYPGCAKRKRFNGFNKEIPIKKSMRILCRIHFNLGIFGLLMCLILFVYLGVAVLLYG